MTARKEPEPPISAYRARLLAAMMVVVSLVAASTLLFTQRRMADGARAEFRRKFDDDVAAMDAAQEVRQAAIAERCRVLARKPRIHAALEDGALDLLYPNARDEMLDATGPDEAGSHGTGAYTLRALYYRFLDAKGSVIAPPDSADAGRLAARDEGKLALAALPDRLQTGYIRRVDGTVDELIAMPIISSETGETISAIVLGLTPPVLGGTDPESGIGGGLLLDGRLDMAGLPPAVRPMLERELSGALSPALVHGEGFELAGPAGSFLVFVRRLNPGSLYPPAYEVAAHSLAGLAARQRRLAWEFAGAGFLVLGAAFLVSHFLSARLSEPVKRLAVDSEENRARRRRAEAALESTSRELQRSARFSADASHQLKTPVTVLRAGLEGLLAGEQLGPEARQEVSGLVHQTFRLSSVVDDLLLLSRMDAGQLRISFAPVDLAALLSGLVDDIGALPEVYDLGIEASIPPSLRVTGEGRYLALILENLIENARKYNESGGRIRIRAAEEGDWAVVTVGNTGAPIPEASREHIFERFHRGAVGENVPGHGIGLNLARELARLHGGDLRLVSSSGRWTEFELRLRLHGESP